MKNQNEPKKAPRGQRLLSLVYAGATIGTTIAIVALARPKIPAGAGE